MGSIMRLMLGMLAMQQCCMALRTLQDSQKPPDRPIKGQGAHETEREAEGKGEGNDEGQGEPETEREGEGSDEGNDEGQGELETERELETSLPLRLNDQSRAEIKADPVMKTSREKFRAAVEKQMEKRIQWMPPERRWQHRIRQFCNPFSERMQDAKIRKYCTLFKKTHAKVVAHLLDDATEIQGVLSDMFQNDDWNPAETEKRRKANQDKKEKRAKELKKHTDEWHKFVDEFKSEYKELEKAGVVAR